MARTTEDIRTEDAMLRAIARPERDHGDYTAEAHHALVSAHVAARRAGIVGDVDAQSNFLASLDGLTYQEARANLELDASAYGWSHETRAAIAIALCRYYFGD